MVQLAEGKNMTLTEKEVLQSLVRNHVFQEVLRVLAEPQGEAAKIDLNAPMVFEFKPDWKTRTPNLIDDLKITYDNGEKKSKKNYRKPWIMTPAVMRRVSQLRKQKVSVKEISNQLGLNYWTLRLALKRASLAK